MIKIMNTISINNGTQKARDRDSTVRSNRENNFAGFRIAFDFVQNFKHGMNNGL